MKQAACSLRFWLVFCLIFTNSGAVYARKVEVEVKSTLNASHISLHDKLVLTITASDPHFINDFSPVLLPMPDFDIVWASTMLKVHSTLRAGRSQAAVLLRRC